MKVSRRDPRGGCECPAPRAGQLLVPSGRQDGTALLAPATESANRVGIVSDRQLKCNTHSSSLVYRLKCDHRFGGGQGLATD